MAWVVVTTVPPISQRLYIGHRSAAKESLDEVRVLPPAGCGAEMTTKLSDYRALWATPESCRFAWPAAVQSLDHAKWQADFGFAGTPGNPTMVGLTHSRRHKVAPVQAR